VNRGDVWWAELPPPMGPRPVVLVSREDAYRVRTLVMVAPVTSRIRGIATEVPLDQGDGLARACVANCDTLQTVPRAQLRRRIARLAPAKLRALDDALRFGLGLD